MICIQLRLIARLSLNIGKLLEKGTETRSDMYAIFESGGKQYRASAGDTLDVEKLPVSVGETVELTNVLMVVDGDTVKVGTPTIENAAIVGHVLGHVKGEKLYVFKSKKRKNYRRKIGHRQKYVRLHIDDIRPGAEAGMEDTLVTQQEVVIDGS